MSAGRRQAALDAVPADAGAVEVIGDNALAERLRLDLAVVLTAPGERPGAVIETTGEGTQLERALARVDDLGTVVLAGPAPEGPVDLDLYADVHVRGLTLVGIASDEADLA